MLEDMQLVMKFFWFVVSDSSVFFLPSKLDVTCEDAYADILIRNVWKAFWEWLSNQKRVIDVHHILGFVTELGANK